MARTLIVAFPIPALRMVKRGSLSTELLSNDLAVKLLEIIEPDSLENVKLMLKLYNKITNDDQKQFYSHVLTNAVLGEYGFTEMPAEDLASLVKDFVEDYPLLFGKRLFDTKSPLSLQQKQAVYVSLTINTRFILNQCAEKEGFDIEVSEEKPYRTTILTDMYHECLKDNSEMDFDTMMEIYETLRANNESDRAEKVYSVVLAKFPTRLSSIR